MTRLDQWLVDQYGWSRSAAQQRIAAHLVLVNNRAPKASQKIKPDDQVEILEPAEKIPETVNANQTKKVSAAEIPLNIVYEDEWLAVIDKPAGLVVHPAPGHPGGTLADALKQHGHSWSHIGGTERAGIVHRLDRFTSGLMVVAKTEAAHVGLSEQLKSRTLGRRYWALVRGTIIEARGRIEAPIARDPRDRQRMSIVESGREAISEFSVLERYPNTTALEMRLLTGRTHQIRVHCAYINHPIVGDTVYGEKTNSVTRLRPALHARSLYFVHPITKQDCQFTADLPAELVALAEQASEGAI